MRQLDVTVHLALQTGLQAPLGLHRALPTGLQVQLGLNLVLPTALQVHATQGAEAEERSERSELEIRPESP